MTPEPHVHVLSRLRSACDGGVHVVSRSLVPRLAALREALHAPRDGNGSASDDEWDFLAVVSRRRHQETALDALLLQLQELVGATEEIDDVEEHNSEMLPKNGLLQSLLQAPSKSREVHWMHLQVDALAEGKSEWQESWREDYRQQILVFEEFLDGEEGLERELAAMGESERGELLTSLVYERRKLEDADVELMPMEEKELLDHAVEKVARVGGGQVAAVPRWFVPRYEVRVVEEGEGGFERVEGEWNGLQVTLEYVTDTEAEGLETRRTHRFAEKWHGVADPHVVTLHGACHVGKMPFLVFESLRGFISMLEYAKNVKHPRKLWKRLLEVARALQHLHRSGIVHGGVSTACMLIGSDGKAKLKPVLGSSEDKDDATSSMEDDVFAFAGAIVEVMESHLSSGFEDFTGSLASIREDQESVGGVNDAVLILIHSMTTSDPHDRPDMTSVVRALLNLADRERTWNDMQFPELLLHAPDVWTALRAASQHHYGGVLMCVRVLARLERVLARLWDEGLSFADGENVEYNWQTRTEHLIRSMRYLTRNYLPSGDQRELLKIAYTRRFTDEIQQIHYQLDALLVEFDNESLMPELSPNDKTSNRSVGDWELQWEYDCGDLVASYHKFLDDLEKYPATALKCEVAMEAMTLMKHELDNFRYGLSDVQLGLMVRAFDICVQRVGATVLSAPEWFIPAYEVRDESWWEGVHVTVQKAGDFFHHQNSRKLCEVVLRQADVWSELVHPHIVELFGACHVGPTPFFVFERARGGSLKEYLTRYRNAFGSTAKSPPHLWQLLYEAALGLQYLHERDIVHKKLCCDNIVVAIEKLSNNRLIKKERRFSREQNAFREVAKLNGLQFVPLRDRQLPQNYLVNSDEDCSGEGSTHVEKWLAPERRNGELAPGPPSLASDIYSFGTIIAEALARGFTASFEGLDDGDLLSESSLPAQLGHDACELVRNMCAQQPELRPTISHVVQQLGSLANRAQVTDRSDSYHSRETEERTSLGNGAQYSDAVGDGIAVADVMLPTETEPLAISQVLEALNSRILEPADGDIDVIPNVEASSGNDLNMQILLRLQDIYERLCAAEACAGEESDHTDNSSCLPNIVSDFAEVLTQFRAHVNASRTGNRITQIAAIRQRASDKFSFHKELDDLLDRLRVYRAFSVTETSQIHDWKWQWYAKRARQTECFEWTLIKPEAFEMLLDELKDARDREEMLAFLRLKSRVTARVTRQPKSKPSALHALTFLVDCPTLPQCSKMMDIQVVPTFTSGARRSGLSRLTKLSSTPTSPWATVPSLRFIWGSGSVRQLSSRSSYLCKATSLQRKPIRNPSRASCSTGS